MVRFFSAIVIALTISSIAAPAFAGQKHGAKGGGKAGGHGHSLSAGHFGGKGGKGLAGGALGLAVGAILLDALANQ
jgi:hypothetical protein